MKKEYNKEHIIYIIEAVENLGIDGFHWEELDEKFIESQKELKKSVDEIIVCLEWIDECLYLLTDFSKPTCYASEIKETMDSSSKEEIPLGCIIAALMHNYDMITYEKKVGLKDLIFCLPDNERERLRREARIIYEL